MRKDLNKLLCERERVASHKKDTRYHAVRRMKQLDEDDKSFESMTYRLGRHNSGGSKHFNENLSPLKGQIRKAVGRKWDDFYSELCEVFDQRSVINQHIMQHIDDFLLQHVAIVDGVYYNVDHGHYRAEPLSESRAYFYVCPIDGTIKRNQWRVGRKERNRLSDERAQTLWDASNKWIDDETILHKIEGHWFIFTLEDVPFGRFTNTYVEDENAVGPYMQEGKEVTFDELLDEGKRRYGKRLFIGEKVRDIYTDEQLYNDGKKVRNYGDQYARERTFKLYKLKYHATKRTAAHKVLKQAGLAY